MKKEYNFEKLDIQIEDFIALLEENRQDVYFVAAMTVVALCGYKENPEKCFAMLDELKNPAEPVSIYEKLAQFPDNMAAFYRSYDGNGLSYNN